jgi:hypothetical protein
MSESGACSYKACNKATALVSFDSKHIIMMCRVEIDLLYIESGTALLKLQVRLHRLENPPALAVRYNFS